MFWLFALALFGFLTVPIAVAIGESALGGMGSRDVGFWALARSVGGTCHVPWGRRRSPVIRFELPDGEARLRAGTGGWRRWSVEVRSYQNAKFGFAARLSSPAAEPVRWRTPGLAPVEVYADDQEYLADYSFESTDERLLRWLLRRSGSRKQLERVLVDSGAERVEVKLLNRVIVIRAQSPKGWKIGSAVEHLGPPMVALLRRLSADLDELGSAMNRTGEFDPTTVTCPACGAGVRVDPYRCPGCGAFMHRGCLEMSDGCINPTCQLVPDALPNLGVSAGSSPADAAADGHADHAV